MVSKLDYKQEQFLEKNYAAYLTTLPELSSLQLMNYCSRETWCDTLSGGFSFITDIQKVEEPKTFRAASTKSEWQWAMQE